MPSITSLVIVLILAGAVAITGRGRMTKRKPQPKPGSFGIEQKVVLRHDLAGVRKGCWIGI